MARLLTVSFPVLSSEATAFIAAFRQKHDAKRLAMVQPHFTLVFGCTEVEPREYAAHVAKVAKASRTIEFSCRYAMLGADDEDETAYVFLVPDQGNSEVALLHDRLYTGPLSSHLRLDLPYIPHITIGVLNSRPVAKSLCDELNNLGLSVSGQLTALVVGHVESGRFHNLSTHALGEA